MFIYFIYRPFFKVKDWWEFSNSTDFILTDFFPRVVSFSGIILRPCSSRALVWSLAKALWRPATNAPSLSNGPPVVDTRWGGDDIIFITVVEIGKQPFPEKSAQGNLSITSGCVYGVLLSKLVFYSECCDLLFLLTSVKEAILQPCCYN